MSKLSKSIIQKFSVEQKQSKVGMVVIFFDKFISIVKNYAIFLIIPMWKDFDLVLLMILILLIALFTAALTLIEFRYFTFQFDFNKNDFIVSSDNELILPIYIIPRIPTQLYEAISYWLIFCFLFWGYWKRDWYLYSGKLFGAFFTLLFASRFIVEFFKEHQTLENSSLLTMGQYLSIPLVGVGLYFWIKSKKIDTHK